MELNECLYVQEVVTSDLVEGEEKRSRFEGTKVRRGGKSYSYSNVRTIPYTTNREKGNRYLPRANNKMLK